MLRLYDAPVSGNAYKVRLLLCQLEIPFERVVVDLAAGAQRSAAFLAMNPIGRVPVLRLEDGSHLAESNAILWYLAQGTPLAPQGAKAQAQLLQWMFFEQNVLEPALGGARYLRALSGQPERHVEAVARLQARGYPALEAIERHLSSNRFFVNGVYTIADIALYAHTHVAHEGGFELDRFPAVQAWLQRVSVEPQHVGIGDSCGAPVAA